MPPFSRDENEEKKKKSKESNPLIGKISLNHYTFEHPQAVIERLQKPPADTSHRGYDDRNKQGR